VPILDEGDSAETTALSGGNASEMIAAQRCNPNRRRARNEISRPARADGDE